MRWLRVLSPVILAACVPLVLQAEEKDTKEGKKVATIGTIERIDPAFDDLVPKGAVLEKLADGFAWTEGPVWVSKGKYLLFSDIPNNRIVKWEQGKKISDFLKPAGYLGKRTDFKEPGTNGLLLDPDGKLVMMEHGDRRVTRASLDKPADKEVLADKYMGKKLNSPNDGVFAKNGDLYFTDPPYGRMLKKDTEWKFPERELDFCGVYRLSKDKKLTLLTKEMTYPNGIALSPDNKTLYVGQSDPKSAIWKAFPINKDGKLGKGKIFHDATKLVGKKKGLPDGMKVDTKGNIWATGPGGVMVFNPKGKLLGVIATGVNTGNCCFGDDGSTLYVMCDKAIGRIKTKAKGLGF